MPCSVSVHMPAYCWAFLVKVSIVPHMYIHIYIYIYIAYMYMNMYICILSIRQGDTERQRERTDKDDILQKECPRSRPLARVPDSMEQGDPD